MFQRVTIAPRGVVARDTTPLPHGVLGAVGHVTGGASLITCSRAICRTGRTNHAAPPRRELSLLESPPGDSRSMVDETVARISVHRADGLLIARGPGPWPPEATDGGTLGQESLALPGDPGELI